jgi:isoquinoline 1-oxidoreductase subunit alpha
MGRYSLTVNGKRRNVEADGDTPLLWVLRDGLGLTGSKYGCGVGVCGACTVLESGREVRSCQVPIDAAKGRRFTTIEGLSQDGSHPCQRAWLDEDVAQCGYCQPGMILAAVSLLGRNPKPTDADVDAVFGEHVCRCGTYPRIRRAVRRASEFGAVRRASESGAVRRASESGAVRGASDAGAVRRARASGASR